jgi:type III pantothenate kinase
MKIVFDQGNTCVKAGIFESDGRCVHTAVSTVLDCAFVEPLLQKYKPDGGILSSVRNPNDTILTFLEKALPRFIPFNSTTKIPIQNGYDSPETLGLDRIAAAVGAWSLKPSFPLLIIDMGTAITYDFVSSEGVFMGGNIAPGMRTRLQALHVFTEKLPLIEPDVSFALLGTSTETAIRAGVMQGIVFEINGYFDALTLMHPNLFAFLTGGDRIFFADKLKNGIFVHENLVLTGLNRILCFNEST